MKKYYKVILVLSIIFILGLLFLSQYQKSIGHLTPQETTKLVSNIYKKLGAHIGSHLVEPNAVLTLGGLRGGGNIIVNNLTKKEKKKIKTINKELKTQGIKFFVNKIQEGTLSDISIFNFKGLEYTTCRSKLPFIKCFNANKGFKGYINYFNQTEKRAIGYFKSKNKLIEKSKLGSPINHLLIGIKLGYPDQALLDMYYSFIKENRTDLISSKIAYSDYYKNPQPNFSFFKKHIDNTSITNTIKSWGNFLKAFYNTPWQKAISKNSEFINMKKLESERHNQ